MSGQPRRPGSKPQCRATPTRKRMTFDLRLRVFVLGGWGKPYKFIGFGDIHGPKSYKFIRFGDIHGPKPCKFIGIG